MTLVSSLIGFWRNALLGHAEADVISGKQGCIMPVGCSISGNSLAILQLKTDQEASQHLGPGHQNHCQAQKQPLSIHISNCIAVAVEAQEACTRHCRQQGLQSNGQSGHQQTAVFLNDLLKRPFWRSAMAHIKPFASI